MGIKEVENMCVSKIAVEAQMLQKGDVTNVVTQVASSDSQSM